MKSKPTNSALSFTREQLLSVFSKCMTINHSAKFLKVSRKNFVSRWKELGLPDPKVTSFKPANEDLPNYKEIGIVSDFHFGSLWQQKSAVEDFCLQCQNRGIEVLLNAGDLTDGMMNWPTHEKERFLHSASSYEEYLEEWYPSGFRINEFILGNHDVSLKTFEDKSYDFGSALLSRRSDLSYHAQDSNGISKAFKVDGGVSVVLYHGTGSCSNPFIGGQTREFRLQSKVVEMLSQGADETSSVFAFGHCHKKCITSFMGKVILGLPGFQADTPYSVSRGSCNDIGGTVLSYNSIGGHITRFSAEFVSRFPVLRNDF